MIDLHVCGAFKAVCVTLCPAAFQFVRDNRMISPDKRAFQFVRDNRMISPDKRTNRHRHRHRHTVKPVFQFVRDNRMIVRQYSQTDKQTNRHTDTQTHRQTNRRIIVAEEKILLPKMERRLVFEHRRQLGTSEEYSLATEDLLFATEDFFTKRRQIRKFEIGTVLWWPRHQGHI
jgi:hypothetical protein